MALREFLSTVSILVPETRSPGLYGMLSFFDIFPGLITAIEHIDCNKSPIAFIMGMRFRNVGHGESAIAKSGREFPISIVPSRRDSEIFFSLAHDVTTRPCDISNLDGTYRQCRRALSITD